MEEEYEMEIFVEDLELLVTPQEFKKFLYSLAEECELTDLTEMYDYFLSQGKIGHCRVIDKFNKDV
jgi:hypothetical protein